MKTKHHDSLADYFNTKDIPYRHYWNTPYGSVYLDDEFGGYMRKLHFKAMTMDHSDNIDKIPVRYYQIFDAIDTLAQAAIESGVELADIFKK
jgi:hypothetical protein